MPFVAPIANWKIADAIASTLACTTAPVASVNNSMYVPQRALYNCPIVFPDRPHARLTFCSLFAGWRCLCPVRHSHHLVFLHLRELRRAERWWCLCQHAALGRWHSLNRQLPSVFQPSLLCTCQPRLQNPIALFHMFRACACRAVAVSLSFTAQSRLRLP